MVQRVAVSHGVSAAFLVNLASGGLAYWPGDWCGVDVKHFLNFFLLRCVALIVLILMQIRKCVNTYIKKNPPVRGVAKQKCW